MGQTFKSSVSKPRIHRAHQETTHSTSKLTINKKTSALANVGLLPFTIQSQMMLPKLKPKSNLRIKEIGVSQPTSKSYIRQK